MAITIQRSQRQLPGQLGQPKTTPEHEGAAIGRGVSEVGAMLRQRQEFIQKQRNETISNRAEVDLLRQKRNNLLDVKRITGDDARDITKKEEEIATQARDTFISKGKDANEKAILADKYDSIILGTYLNEVATHEGRQISVARQRAMDDVVNEYFQIGVDAPVVGGLETLEVSAQKIAANSDDADSAQTLIDKMYNDHFKSVAQKNPEDAQKIYDDNKDRLKDLLGAGFNEIPNTINTVRKDKKIAQKAIDEQRNIEIEKAQEKEREILGQQEIEFEAGKGNPIELIDNITKSSLPEKEKRSRKKEINNIVEKQQKAAAARRKEIETTQGKVNSRTDYNSDFFAKTMEQARTKGEVLPARRMTELGFPIEKQNQVHAASLTYKLEKQEPGKELPSDPIALRNVNRVTSRAEYLTDVEVVEFTAALTKSNKDGDINDADFLKALVALSSPPTDKGLLNKYHDRALNGAVNVAEIREAEQGGIVPKGTLKEMTSLAATHDKTSPSLKKQINDMRFEITSLGLTGGAEFEALTAINRWVSDNPGASVDDALKWFQPQLDIYIDERAAWWKKVLSRVTNTEREPIQRVEIQ